MRKKPLQYILFIVIFTLAVGGIGYILTNRLSDWKSGRGIDAIPTIEKAVDEKVKKVGEIEKDDGQTNTNNKKQSIDTSNWITYRNDEVGITFRHPLEYCVGFVRGISVSKNGLPSFEYLIRVANAYYAEYEGYKRENPGIQVVSPCEGDSPGPGDPDIFRIATYYNPTKSVQNWRTSHKNNEIKEFELPPTTIDGIATQRSILGEGRPNRGIPFYNFFFQRGMFLFVLSTIVEGKAKEGNSQFELSQDGPRGQPFVEEADEIVKTIHFLR